MTEEVTDNDKCCIYGKVLFINGKRQTNLCYYLGLQRKLITSLMHIGQVVVYTNKNNKYKTRRIKKSIDKISK